MSIKFTKRAASLIMKRGESAIKIKKGSEADANNALTKEDVRKLISSGAVYAVKEKKNLSLNAKKLKKLREEGRRRGTGRRKGTRKARMGRKWEKKVRAQRAVLREVKGMGLVDSKVYNAYYRHIKGNVYATKATLIAHMKEAGIKLGDAEVKKINEALAARYRRGS
jgi:large subunit ribosomal protein L19e